MLAAVELSYIRQPATLAALSGEMTTKSDGQKTVPESKWRHSIP